MGSGGSLRLKIEREQDGPSGNGHDGGFEEVATGFDPDELRGFEQTVEQRSDFRAALGPGAVLMLSVDDKTAEGSFGGVVVERDRWVVEESGQPGPEPQHVLDCFAKAAFGKRPRKVIDGPLLNLADDRLRALGVEYGEFRTIAAGLTLHSADSRPT